MTDTGRRPVTTAASAAEPTVDALFRGEFGFTWGETDGTRWLRNADGDYKRIHPTFFDLLCDLAERSAEPSAHDERVRRTVASLSAEGYLEPGGDVVRFETPPDVRLWPRVGAFVATVALLGCCLAVRLPELRRLPADLEFGFGLSVVVLPILLASIGVHELGHYLPSRRYFDPSIRLGLLNGVIPAIITRTTDAWACPRNVRIWISLAGPFADTLIATAFAGAFVLAPHRPVLGFVALLIGARVAFVCNPLIEGDGYWILVDALGWHNLRTHGFRDLQRRTPSGPAAYALASVAFTVAFVCLNLVVLASAFGIA